MYQENVPIPFYSETIIERIYNWYNPTLHAVRTQLSSYHFHCKYTNIDLDSIV